MTIASMPGGLWFPQCLSGIYGIYNSFTAFGGNTNETAMAATGDKLAMIGYAKVDGRATGKVLSAAGGGSIVWRSAAVTFANGGTTLDLGIQGVNTTSAGPEPQPNGVFTVKRTFTGGGGGITANATQTHAMTGGSGTVTINHGDLIAIVWDMTARAGADSVIINGGPQVSTGGGPPLINMFLSGAWRTSGTSGKVPNAYIITDDGTLVTLDDSIPLLTLADETFSDSTNPDERGLIFQVPWDCKVDALWGLFGPTDGSSSAVFTLYSDPLGTPTSLGNFTIEGEFSIASGSSRYRVLPFASEISLSANTDYAVAIKAAGTTNTRLPCHTLMSASLRVFNPGGTSVKKITRDGGSGAFTAEATPTTMYGLGVRISGFNVSSTNAPARVYQA